MYIQAVECLQVFDVKLRCGKVIELVSFVYTADNGLENCPFPFGQSLSTRWPKNQLLDGVNYFDRPNPRDSLGDQTAVSILVCQSILEMKTGLEHDHFEVLSKRLSRCTVKLQ